MDPLHPIVPLAPVIPSVAPASPGGRVERDPGRRRRDAELGQPSRRRPPEEDPQADDSGEDAWAPGDDDETPHIDITV